MGRQFSLDSFSATTCSSGKGHDNISSHASTVGGNGTVIICPGGNYEFLCPNEGPASLELRADRAGELALYLLASKCATRASILEGISLVIGLLACQGVLVVFAEQIDRFLVEQSGEERQASSDKGSCLQSNLSVHLFMSGLDTLKRAHAGMVRAKFWTGTSGFRFPSLGFSRGVLFGVHSFSSRLSIIKFTIVISIRIIRMSSAFRSAYGCPGRYSGIQLLYSRLSLACAQSVCFSFNLLKVAVFHLLVETCSPAFCLLAMKSHVWACI